MAILLALIVPAPTALARHPEVVTELREPRMIGQARYQVLAWPVFEAELWTGQAGFSWEQPFALSLTYRRNISADALVARSVSGMTERTRVENVDNLTGALRACFADVRAGDRITGVSTSPDRARFYLNNRQTCDLSWPGFRRAFFGIWLDADGADRAFSARLTGRAAGASGA